MGYITITAASREWFSGCMPPKMSGLDERIGPVAITGEQNATARARRGATPSYPAAHRRDL